MCSDDRIDLKKNELLLIAVTVKRKMREGMSVTSQEYLQKKS